MESIILQEDFWLELVGILVDTIEKAMDHSPPPCKLKNAYLHLWSTAALLMTDIYQTLSQKMGLAE